MKILNLILIVIVLSFVSCENQAPAPEATPISETSVEVTDGVFIHVSSGYDNPQKALMAVSLATLMAETHDVTLFFDIQGVNLLTKNSEDIEMDAFKTLHGAFEQLVEQKVQIMACPMCMKKAGIEADQLRDGVIVAEKEKFFDFTEGRILSLDY